MSHDIERLASFGKLVIRQKQELAELIGFETRNRYEITDESARPVLYAAEQGKGFLGLMARGFFGHWRKFEVHIFNPVRELVIVARHPFRWFFQRLEVFGADGQLIGALEQRFSVFSKKFDVEDANGRVMLTVNSPLFSLWTFRFMDAGQEVAVVTKKWGGLLTELFTDKDQFLVDFQAGKLTATQRAIMVASAIFIDLQYFENKASG